MSATLGQGTVFAGRYRILRSLAVGGMGAVYEVLHTETDRRRALKVMHPHLFQSDEMRQRFKREAKIAANVESEYIVDVFDAGVDEATGMPYLVMELLRGEELGVRLARMGRLPPAEVVTYLQQAAWALDKTHAASIVHRDLKPENLFVTQREDGSARVKILDFGVAKLVAEGATGAGGTRSLGTPLYMAPEQFRTNANLTGAADIYALGMMAYTLLVGEPYWSQEARGSGDVIAFAMVTIHGPAESAVGRALVRGVALPPAFDGWFGRVTAVNPAERYPTATEAVGALREVMAAAVGADALAMSPVTMIAGPMTTPFALTPPPMVGMATPTTGFPQVSGSRSNPGLAMPTVALPTISPVPAPVGRSRAPWVALSAALALGMVGVGSWALLRTRSPSAPVGTIEISAASAPIPLASSAVVVAVATAVDPPPAEPAPPLPAPSVEVDAGAPVVVAAPVPKSPGPKPDAGRKAPVTTKGPAKTLLGRD